MYANVKFRGQRGKLRLTETKIAFKPYDWGDDGVYDSWRWKAILKHQINGKNAKKALIKLVSREDSNKCVIFRMQNKTELDSLRKDVASRLRLSKTSQSTRLSLSSIDGEIFHRRSSEVSFQSRRSTSSRTSNTSISPDDDDLVAALCRAKTKKTSI